MGALAVVLCIGLLLVSSLTSQKTVQIHAEESAAYFKSRELFEKLIKNQEAVKRDNYADCISSGIAYQLGNKEPVSGTDRTNSFIRILEARYTDEEGENVNDGFYRAVMNGDTPNQTYSRYWHGGAAIIRLLLTAMNVSEMRMFMFILGIVINLAWIAFLVVKKEYLLTISYLFAIIAGKILFGYTCFEYAFVCFLIPVISFAVYKTMENNRMNAARMKGRPTADGSAVPDRSIAVEGIFLIAGILTCFFDFLTAETATFTIPAFVAVCCLQKETAKSFTIRTESTKKKQKASLWRFALTIAACWLIGYAGMFLLKWGLNAIFLGPSEAMSALSYAAERSVGEVHVTSDMASPAAGLWQRIEKIFLRNFACLYGIPSEMKESAVAVIAFIVPAFLYIFWFFLRDKSKLHTKEKKDHSFFFICLILALIPILRFLVLSNHSYMHYFFTYRALMADVMIVTYWFLKTTVIGRFLEN